MGDACARDLIRRRLLPDVCRYCVSRGASVTVVQRGLLVAVKNLPITLFLSNFCSLAILKNVNTETRV